MADPSGINLAMQTPFTADGGIDYTRWEELIDLHDFQGVHRYATMDDLNSPQKLNHMAATVQVAGGPIVEPVDVPVAHRHLHMACSGLKSRHLPGNDRPSAASLTVR